MIKNAFIKSGFFFLSKMMPEQGTVTVESTATKITCVVSSVTFFGTVFTDSESLGWKAVFADILKLLDTFFTSQIIGALFGIITAAYLFYVRYIMII